MARKARTDSVVERAVEKHMTPSQERTKRFIGRQARIESGYDNMTLDDIVDVLAGRKEMLEGVPTKIIDAFDLKPGDRIFQGYRAGRARYHKVEEVVHTRRHCKVIVDKKYSYDGFIGKVEVLL